MQGNLFLFSNVISAATTTIPSFKYMMSTFSHDSQEAWYKHQTLPQIAKDSGYKTCLLYTSKREYLMLKENT